jgi:7,8-dihydropterin-6-yl-methyl-4-(beta-D-ribofuranosyl)aminobenzene 5'-phosphate synthase
MKKLGIDPSDIGSVVLSHGHGDHTGGLFELLEENQDLSVYIPAQLSRALKSQIPTKTRLIEVREPMQIREEVFTTGELGTFIKEQSLVYLNRRGAFVITGCSHPGLGTILNAALKFGEVYGIIGGFHGFSDFNILKGVKLISPCHCTQYKREIARAFPKQYVRCGAGLVIE